MVTEYLGHDSINLFDLIESQKGAGFGESIGRFFFAQLLDAIEYIHEEVSICHRDLKLENILLTGKLQLKVIDFGLSSGGDLSCVTGAVGSPSYVAPEVLTEDEYDGKKVDVFSLGVLLFVIVVGKFPHGPKILEDKYYALIKAKK